jgi:DNA-binding transcriptional ArsR family regulator
LSRARYSIIPTAAVRDKSLSEIQFRCLCVIGTYLGEDQSAFPSQSTLAEDLGVTRETVNRAIKVLVEKGYVVSAPRFREDGGQTSSMYRVILDVETSPKDLFASLPCDSGDTPGVTQRRYTGGDAAGSHQEDTQSKIPNELSAARDVFDHYSKEASEVGWIQHAKFTAAIEKHVNARIKEYGAENVKRFITALSSQEWTYKGFKGSPEFRASLVYICRPRTFAEHFDKLCPPETAPTRRILDLHNGLTRENWYNAVEWFYESDGQWDLDHISPPPGQPGCLAPPDMLKELAR